jgi:hypothetical protein
MTDLICETNVHGTKRWRNEKGEYHRLDGPAVEMVLGSKSWFVNGKLHRSDGPAIECPSGYKVWYVNGKLHRLDGPAVEYADGDKTWWIVDVKLTKKVFEQHPLVVFYRLCR